MHGALSHHPVLSLTADSIAGLGDLDATSLSDLWGVFTKCKDSLQDGRRLENLSWRLWFDSGRKEAKEHYADRSARDASESQSVLGLIGPSADFVQAGWSDPEWTETTDSDSDDEDARSGRPQDRRASTSKSPSASPAAPTPVATGSRPQLANRGSSGGPFDRRSTSTITGGSLQRMITGLTTLPALAAPSKGLTATKARSCVNVPVPTGDLPSPRLATRGASAPDVNIPPLVSPLLAPPTHASPPPRKPDPIASTSLLRSPPLSTQLSAAARTDSARSMANTANAAARSDASTPTPRRKAGPASTAKAPAPPASPAPRPHAPRASGSGLGGYRNDSLTQLTRNVSTASFEPKSLVKGFDTTAFDSRPHNGSIAPPPTPAQAASAELASPPPPVSAMKSASARPSTGKKIFFISSPNSDSDDEHSPTRHHHHPHKISPPKASNSIEAPASTRAAPQGRPADEDDWDDEDDEGASDDSDESDDDASSGWGSEYSTEAEDASGSRPRPERPSALFAKRPSIVQPPSELKPRPAGLLSQLFHPGLMDEDDRRHSTADVTRTSKPMPSLHTSRSAGLLTEQLRNKSFLRGAPAGTEMESSSDEEEGNPDEDEDEDEDDYEDESASSSEPTGTVAAALARHQRQRLEAAGPIAPPQTPRTTRRAMLATELSESLRRNLLWERQTRNRVLGAPVDPRFRAPPPALQNNPQTTRTVPGGAAAAAAAGLLAQEGLRAPHPSPVTRDSSPVPPMVRRHTTGTGLYLAAQTGALAQGRKMPSSHSSESSFDEDDEPVPAAAADVYGSAFTHGLHHHGW